MAFVALCDKSSLAREILCRVIKLVPNVLFCMPNRTQCILLVTVMHTLAGCHPEAQRHQGRFDAVHAVDPKAARAARRVADEAVAAVQRGRLTAERAGDAPGGRCCI
jgi:hypothetical protein